MLRLSVMGLAALLLAAVIALAPAKALASGHFGSGWYGGWSEGSHWDFYGGKFVVSDTHTYLHEYSAYDPGCAWLRRLVPTPYGPQWQLVPVCF
jgi:hypothetical protein